VKVAVHSRQGVHVALYTIMQSEFGEITVGKHFHTTLLGFDTAEKVA